MTQPRVLFLDQSGALGGAELYLLDIARRFRDTSRVVLFEDGPFKERLAAHDIPVEVCSASQRLLSTTKSSGWGSAAAAGADLLRLGGTVARRARDFDLLYANTQKALFVAGLAGMLARRPVIWNLHDMLTAAHFSWFNRTAATLWATLFTDHVVVNSKATQRAFVDGGGDDTDTTVVYNGIDETPFNQVVQTPKDQLRSQLGLPEAPTVGVFSRLAPWKGQHVVLKALSRLPDVEGVFVGDTLFRDDKPYEDELHDLACTLGVQDRAHFLGFRDDIPSLMRAVDIVVHASTQPEPFGRVIVEGMMAQRPVIATQAGGAQEIIDHGDTGLLIDPNDPQGLADAIDWILTTPQAADQMAEAGRQSACARFSIDAMIRKISEIIHQFAIPQNEYTHSSARPNENISS